jgi:hypothetical protein
MLDPSTHPLFVFVFVFTVIAPVAGRSSLVAGPPTATPVL